jgi:hypothetical protein
VLAPVGPGLKADDQLARVQGFVVLLPGSGIRWRSCSWMGSSTGTTGITRHCLCWIKMVSDSCSWRGWLRMIMVEGWGEGGTPGL